MKKSLHIILLLTIFMIGSVDIKASSGKLKSDSIKTCNGITYGYHSDHWHVAELKASGSYYPLGDAIYSDPCSSNSNSSNNDSSNIDNDSSSSNNSSSSQSSSEDSSSSDNSGSNSSTNNNSSSGSNPNNSSSSSSNNTSTSNQNSSNFSNNNSSIEIKEERKSNDNTLKIIIIDGKEVDVEDIIDYSTTKEKITIKATTNDKNAKYEIKNNSKLEVGDNKILIEVTAEDGTTKTYNINVKREKILNSDTGIKLIINEEEVAFDEDYKATVNIGSSISKLTIDYELSDDKAKVEMDELDKLKTGDNILKIKVTAEDDSSQIYEITIHKYSKTEDTIYTILAFAMIGGIGYGIYYIIKKVKNKIKRS